MERIQNSNSLAVNLLRLLNIPVTSNNLFHSFQCLLNASAEFSKVSFEVSPFHRVVVVIHNFQFFCSTDLS